MPQERCDSFRYDCDFEDIDDTFQNEIVDGKQVHKCNICNEELDKDAEIKNHIEEKYKKIIIQITKDLEENKEVEGNDDSMTTLSDNDQDEAFLARLDEYRNCIG